jgi:hypothetical protein
MPTIKRRGLRRTPTDFAGIAAGERIRWSLGIVLIRGEFTPVRHTENPGIPVWGSWAEWVQAYHLCREPFLAWYAERPTGHPPYAELLFAAHERGEDPGAVVIDRGPDPRSLLAGCRP